MANTVTIVVRIKQGARYPFKPAVFLGRKPTPGYCLVNGVPEHHPEGRFYLRFKKNGKDKLEPIIGNDAVDAVSLAIRREAKLKLRAEGEAFRESEPVGKSDVDVYEIYCEEMRANKAKRTYQAYANSIRLFRDYYQRELSDLKRSDMLAFKTYLKAQEFAPRTVYNHFLNLTIFLKWAQVKTNLKNGDWPPKPEREPEEYTDAEIETLLKTATDEERLVLNSFLCSGLRSGELAHLTYGDIDFEHSIWSVKPKADWNTKTDESQRSAPVPVWLTKKIAARQGLLTKRDFIFATRKGSPDLYLLRIVKRVAKRAGLTDIRVDNHKFRSTAITRWLQDGCVPMDVKQWVGHKDLDTIMRYYA
jgi:integrase